MSRLRMIVVGLLAVLTVGAVVASAASGAVQGPWWMKLEAGKQVKIEPGKHLQIKSFNEGAFLLKSKVSLMAVTIECRKVENKGFIWNGPHTGRDEAEVIFTNCFMVTPCAGLPITVAPTKTRTELMWKYQGVSKELEEAGGSQKIYDVFAPEEEPVEFEAGKFRAKFTTITVPPEAEGIKCAVAAEYPVYARGTVYNNWEDQNGTKHKVIWGTAALVEPQNMDVKTGKLKWELPNVKKLHVEGVEEEAKLQLGNEPAELSGTVKVEATTGGIEFGAWNEL